MKTFLLLSVLSIFLLYQETVAQEYATCEFRYGTWTRKAPMPAPGRNRMASGVINNKIYIAGGNYVFNGDSIVPVNTVAVYDPVAGTWETIDTPIPLVRDIHEGNNSVLDGKLYVVGGLHYVKAAPNYLAVPFARVDAYDPQSDTWELKANLPEPLGGNGICDLDGKLYVTGGWNSSNAVVKSVYMYDAESDTWTSKADMTTPRVFHSCVVLNGKIYAIGGGESGTDPFRLKSAEVYDPDLNQWTPIAQPIVGTVDASACVLGGEIYSFGGRKGSTPSGKSYAFKYNPESDVWTRIENMPARRSQHVVEVVGGTIYLIAGRSGWWQTNKVDAYDPSRVVLESSIPDTTIDGSTMELDLSQYFSQVDGTPVTFTSCISDTNIVSASIDGHILKVAGLSAGDAVVTILAESGTDQMGDEFAVNVTLPTGISSREMRSPAMSVFPNPTTGITTLKYEVKVFGEVRLKVYDMLGKQMAYLVNEIQLPGSYQCNWNTKGLEPAIYFCELTTPDTRAAVKLIVEQ